MAAEQDWKITWLAGDWSRFSIEQLRSQGTMLLNLRRSLIMRMDREELEQRLDAERLQEIEDRKRKDKPSFSTQFSHHELRDMAVRLKIVALEDVLQHDPYVLGQMIDIYNISRRKQRGEDA